MAETSNGKPGPRPGEEVSDGPFRGRRTWRRPLRRDRGTEQDLRTSLEELIEEHEEEPIDPQERAILANILKLHELTANDVMVPRVDIVALEAETASTRW